MATVARCLEPLAACLDVAAHEFTHGVISYESNLIYQNQSGALNESLSDIMAAMVDRDDWLLGEDCTRIEPGFLRSLSTPGMGSSWQPAHMSEYRQLPNTDAGDQGGVHVNSGIPNRAAYLIAEGLSIEGIGESIGRDKTEQIFYRALTMLTRDAEFIDAAAVSLAEAEALYGVGSTEARAVEDAWESVGVSGLALPDSSGGSGTIASASGDDLMVYLYPADGTHDLPATGFLSDLPADDP